VIEVGINVPNASIIVIEEAERFGLSQLHQLRGRVGRGEKQSYCILLHKKNLSSTAFQRLKIMKSTNDGFILADEDLKIRGSGDIVGTKQSGLPNFKVANIYEQQSLLTHAHSYAKQIIRNDPDLQLAKSTNIRFLLEIFDYSGCIPLKN
jgi:ATP-dependent DNA helicase RecG